jgi:enterochelin esterase-like enzyme
MEAFRFRSAALGREMRASVYAPRGWNHRDPLPLVVFLHGLGGDEREPAWGGLTAELDRWIGEGRIRPFLMVSPDGEEGFWANWHDGTVRYEDYVVDDVISVVRRRFPVQEGRPGLHLVGVSMGGVGTLYTALHNLDRFSSAAVVSAPIFDVDETLAFLSDDHWENLGPMRRIYGPPEREHVERENAFARLSSRDDLRGLRLFVAAGTDDSFFAYETTLAFHRALDGRGVPHRYLEFDGGHEWSAWRRVIPVALCHNLPPDGGCRAPPDPFYRMEATGQ